MSSNSPSPTPVDDGLGGLPRPVADFLAHKSGRAVNTVATYRRALASYVKWRGGADVTEGDYDRFILHLRQRRRRQNTIALSATVIREYAKRTGSDVEDWQVPRTQEVAVDHLRMDEIRALRRAAMAGGRGEEHLFIVDFLLGTGLRVGELVTLKWSDMDLAGERTVTVREAKENKTRTLVLLRDPLNAALRYLDHRFSKLVTPAEARQVDAPVSPIRTRSAVGKMLAEAGARAGLAARGIHPHLLRHTFAVNWLQRGLDVRRLQAYLGHSSLETTARYLQISGTEGMKALADVSLTGQNTTHG